MAEIRLPVEVKEHGQKYIHLEVYIHIWHMLVHSTFIYVHIIIRNKATGGHPLFLLLPSCRVYHRPTSAVAVLLSNYKTIMSSKGGGLSEKVGGQKQPIPTVLRPRKCVFPCTYYLVIVNVYTYANTKLLKFKFTYFGVWGSCIYK